MENKLTRKSLNNDTSSELSELIEELTHSGSKCLDSSKLNKVKSICMLSDKNVEQFYYLLVHQLEENHSEIRLSAFQLCDEIFRISNCFRQLVVDNLKRIFELTAEINFDSPLPLPRTAALTLKRLALITIKKWCETFGAQYKKLIIGFNFLKQCKKVDFDALQLQSDTERTKKEEEERKYNLINKERVKRVKNEVKDVMPDISSTVTSLTTCLNLLLPKPEEFFISFSDNNGDSSNNDNRLCLEYPNKCKENELEDEGVCEGIHEDGCESTTSWREFGAVNKKHSIEINLRMNEINSLIETSENEVIIENVRDNVRIITNKYLPRTEGWLQVLVKAEGNEALMKIVTDLKNSMEMAVAKYRRLHIKTSECVSSDSELEEVKEEIGNVGCSGKSSSITTTKEIDKSVWSILSQEKNTKDPTSIHASLESYKKHKVSEESINKSSKPCSSKSVTYAEPSTSNAPDNGKSKRKTELLKIAPKLPFDVDLYHWEDEHLVAPTLIPTSLDSNKFWASASGDDILEVALPEGSTSLRTRVIEFTGEFKPVTKVCRAPLQNGKLCPRKDRHKCPFHGPVVPRDETGKCINPEDERKFQAEEEKRVPDWQDPKLLKEIKETTGIDLKMPEKGKRKKVKKYPGLTDIKANQNTSRSRISKKVFNRASVKRVAQTLDKIEHRRFRDKYGDQFHYMHDTA